MNRSEQYKLACLYEEAKLTDISDLRQDAMRNINNPAKLATCITAINKSGISKDSFMVWLNGIAEMYPAEIQAAKEHKSKLVELKKNPILPDELDVDSTPLPPPVDLHRTSDDVPLSTTKELGLKSVLTHVMNSGLLKTEKDPIKLREEIIKQINGSRCQNDIKFRMTKILSNLNTVEKISQYVVNAMFMHNKLGVVGKRPNY